MQKGTKKLIIILIVLIIVVGILMGIRIALTSQKNKSEEIGKKEQNDDIITTEIEEKQVQIFQGNDRPIAVMIDNSSEAWPQAGLNHAYMVYEIIVEGGETRLMALFKGTNLDKIGPIRSARHYFIDYVLENDAIYTHFGWSPQAEKDIKSYNIDNINGIVESSETFWRVRDKYSPHNAVTSTKALLDVAKNRKYKTKSDKKSVLNYVTDEVNLKDGKIAETVSIPYSTLQKVKYEYDAENKIYKRFARNKAQTDWDTGNSITTKNIIITFAENYTLDDGENKGRQGLRNIGTLNGYYITNGKAIKIKCKKELRTGQTVYQDLDGNEIDVNDGNTWVQICPKDANVIIEGNQMEENV